VAAAVEGAVTATVEASTGIPPATLGQLADRVETRGA
jgi:hypothetical protein